MIHALGWTWTTAEAELDLHRLQALTRHWQACPPVHVLVRDYLGYQPPKPALSGSTEATGELAEALAGMPIRKAAPLDDTAWRQFANHPTPTTTAHG